VARLPAIERATAAAYLLNKWAAADNGGTNLPISQSSPHRMASVTQLHAAPVCTIAGGAGK
jgi:hypothetical protein